MQARIAAQLIIGSERHGNWYREVVQRLQRLRIHHAGRRRQGSVLPSQRDSRLRLQIAQGWPEGLVRRDARPEGPRRDERQAPLSNPAQERKPASAGFFFFQEAYA